MPSAETRPDPDALLASLKKEEQKSARGHLKIFLGMCPGVGKTYTMLEAAHSRKKEGIDVVVGVVETHGRTETAALLTGLEQIPRQSFSHKETLLEEMDLDGILKRRPQLVLVDELAHSNAPGARHGKRHQDVLELLDSGISVYSTLNVQHIESRVEVVRQITGVSVRESVPDSIFDRADEVELVDLTPDQLLKRLSEGRVYLGDRAETAAANFFKLGNLTALREMALRFTAERVGRDLRDFMRERKITGPWKSSERLLVGVGPSPYSESLIRWTRRIAGSLNAQWIAAYIDQEGVLSEEDKSRVTRNLSLARQLGGEVLTVSGEKVGESLLRLAHEQNVTQIVVGKPQEPWWRRLMQGGSLVDQLLQKSGDVDIYVVRPEKSHESVIPRPGAQFPAFRMDEILSAAAIAGGITLAGWLMVGWMGYWSVALLYLMGVVAAAMFLSRWVVLLLATTSALLWDFLFIPPVFTFAIREFHDFMMFIMMFIVALAMGHLTSLLRSREKNERERQLRTEALLKLTQSTTLDYELDAGLASALRQIETLFKAKTALVLRTDDHELETKIHPASSMELSEKEMSVVHWSFDKKQPAGKFTDTLPQSEALYLPLFTRTSVMGVLGIKLPAGNSLDMYERQLAETFASQLALTLEKDHFLHAVQRAELLEQSDRLRRTLLDNVSHELKTPVAAISAALDALSGSGQNGNTCVKEIRIACDRLQKVVGLLLESARIETGVVQPQKVWCDLDEIIQNAQKNCLTLLSGHTVESSVPALPPVKLDPDLMEQVLTHLLTNAGIHTPPGTSVKITATLNNNILQISVSDNGGGLPDTTRIFDKFHRGENAKPGGVGLGLSIVRGFMHALGGSVRAQNSPEGGAEFILTLPVETGVLPGQTQP